MTDAAAQESSAVRPEETPFRGGGRLISIGLLAGGLGSLVTIAGAILDPQQAAFSYLIAFTYVLSLALGSMAFVMAVHAANATWPVAVRRVAEASMSALPLLAVLFLPVVVGAPWLFPWMHPRLVEEPHARELLAHKLGYLNLPFFLIRAAACFGVWIAVAALLRRWSLCADHPQGADRRKPMRILSSLSLPLFGITGTLAAWDWMMSLSPTFYSTMFGLYYLAGGFLGALALLCLGALGAHRAGWLPGISPSHHYALGRLLFAFLVFWAYSGYWQYFIAWIANRPIEAEWFLARVSGGYRWVAGFLIVGHFALPFFVLLSYWIKRRASALRIIAAWLLFAHYLDVHWIIAAARHRPFPFSWMDLTALAAVGGFCLAFVFWRQRGHLVAPVHDPLFLRALRYESQ